VTSLWWRDAVIYQVYPRSFADSTGDGVGDLAGVRSRLTYLRDLGVDAVWLSPFYRSPMIDGGYDISDYRDVDPMFGTLDDFDALAAEAHGYGLRIIVDLVPNHCSAEHPWFVTALATAPGAPARRRFVFRPGRGASGEEPPNDWESIFGGPAWTRVPDGSWYLHLFDPSQPDLNWQNFEVHAEFEEILRFWLDRGVDGFRVDVAHGMVKADGLPDMNRARAGMLDTSGTPYFDQDGVHEIYREWRKILDSYAGDRMAVAEAWVPSPERVARYVRSDELHQAFNFDYLTAPWRAEDLRRVIDVALSTCAAVGAPATWVLGNHDTVRPATRYGSLARARAAALLTFALPGSAYLYQGEELGLPEVTDLPDEARLDPAFARSGHSRDGCRVPLPWSGGVPPYGFGSRAATWLPQPPGWGPLTVEAQTGDPHSILELYRAALRIRRSMRGGMQWVETRDPDVLAFRRDSGLVCVVNLSSAPVSIHEYGGSALLASASSLDDGTVPPDTTVWLAPMA
jgi:alpha-glucosidase